MTAHAAACPSAHPEPMHGPRRLQVVDIQSTQVTIRWEPLGYNVTRCHSYNLTVQYRSKVSGKEETREEVCYDTQSRDPQHTIHNLTPFTNLSVKLVLRNPEGVMESKELEVQTDEDGKCGDSNPSLQLSPRLPPTRELIHVHMGPVPLLWFLTLHCINGLKKWTY